MTDDGWKGGQDSQAYVDHLKAEVMTDARDIVEEQTLKECGCCGNMHIMEWNDDYVASLRKQLEDARSEALEEAAAIVDQCNREGPYNAIGAAKRIRALKGKS